MNFQDAIQQGFRNYFNFSGRASRSEFWYWVLFSFVLSILISIADSILVTGGVLSGLLALAMFIPHISITVRRLHDIDKCGWWILFYLIPVVGWIFILIWECTKGTDGPNRFGPNPLSLSIN